MRDRERSISTAPTKVEKKRNPNISRAPVEKLSLFLKNKFSTPICRGEERSWEEVEITPSVRNTSFMSYGKRG